MDTRLYELEFLDGEVTLLMAIMVAQAMYVQCNVDGNEYLLLECFVEIEKDPTAISLDKQRTVHNGQEYLHHTTLGWHMCCQWKDSSISWKRLLDIKESHPLQTAGYSVAMGVDHKPGFNWWVPRMLKKCNAIIALSVVLLETYAKVQYRLTKDCRRCT